MPEDELFELHLLGRTPSDVAALLSPDECVQYLSTALGAFGDFVRKADAQPISTGV
jgi:hypothetical protein